MEDSLKGRMKSNFRKIVGMSLTIAMLTSLVVMAVPALALTTAVVTTNNSAVSQNGTWDIRFSVSTAIGDNTTGGNITITFPSGFTVNQSAANVSSVTVAGGDGWTSTTNFGAPVLTVTTINSTSATRKIRIAFAANDVIGADAQVRIILPLGVVTNPSTPGSYNITIATSNETTAVTSNSFSITLPNLGPLPGLVLGKNSNGDTLYQAVISDLSAAIATPGVSRIELAAGTYNATNTLTTTNLTLIGVGAPGTVILTAPAAGVPLTITANGTVVDNVVINGNIDGTANLINVTANSTIKNVTLSGGVYQINIAPAVSLASFPTSSYTVDNVTFGVTGNVSCGLNSTSTDTSNVTLTVTRSTFNVDAGGTGIASTSNVTLSNSIFAGSSTSPIGVATSNGTSTIKGNTFTNLNKALVVSGTTVTYNSTGGITQNGTIVTATGNTITGNGATSGTGTNGAVTCSGGVLVLTNNTIKDIGLYVSAILVSGGNVSAHFNTIGTGNTFNARQTSGNGDLQNNWWGVNTGPVDSSLNATTAANLVTTPYLKAAVDAGSGAFASVTTNLTAKATAGVDVTSNNASLTMGAVAAAKYAANPQSVAPTGTPVAYYDVFVQNPSAGQQITIKFYATVTDNTKVYYGGGLSGAWSLAGTQGVNVNSGYAYVTIDANTSPVITDLDETPFVLTNIVPPPAAPAVTGPIAGATGVPINTGFSWTAVAGATSYDFQISTSPTFATLVVPAVNTAGTVYGGVALAANTTYFWRVHAMTGTVMGAWTTSTFTTAAPAAAAVAPNITVAAPPPANVTVTAPTVNVAAPPPAVVNVAPPTVNVAAPPAAVVNVSVPEQPPLVPAYLLWTIILIGAVLIIALIVLIVRTRRVA